MMNNLKKYINLGITESLSESEKRGVKVFNIVISLFLLLLVVMSLFVNIFSFSIYSKIVSVLLVGLMMIPVLLNYHGKTIVARVMFVLLTYTAILLLSIFYGGELHFQFFILFAVTLPLIFFDKEIGIYKWLLVLIAMPQGLYQELHFILFDPFIHLTSFEVYWIGLSNNIIIFLIVWLIVLIFSDQYYKQFRSIEKSNLKLQQNNEELNQFAHIISHDLKVPLRLVNSLTDIIVNEYQQDFDEELNEYFELIKSSVKNMDGLITSVLEYSKAGRDGLEISTFKIEKIFNEITTLLDIPKSINVFTPSKEISITGSYAQLKQVLVNLIENAIKYHHKEGGFVTISIKEIKNHFVVFNIADNGPGIKKHFQDRLFQIFQTASERPEIESTGVGLAIVKKIVEQNGGKLSFNSVYGEGSTFSFTWPINIDKPIQLLK